MSEKNNSDSEYYGRDLVTWCKVCNVYNMLAKYNSNRKYYGRDLVKWYNFYEVCNIKVTNVKRWKAYKL